MDGGEWVVVVGGVPSDYLVSTQLQLWLFCCWGCGCCWAVTSCFYRKCLFKSQTFVSDSTIVSLFIRPAVSNYEKKRLFIDLNVMGF